MKYYSETLKKLFDSEKELNDAEARQKAIAAAKVKAEELKKQEKAKRAKEVEEALKASAEAQKRATELLNKFTEDYGWYHTSLTSEDTDDDSFVNILKFFLR